MDAIGRMVGDIDPLGRVSRSEYDRLSRLTKAIDADPDGSGSQVALATTFAYDAMGNLLAETDGAGKTERHEYDSLSRRVRTTDGRGDRTTRRYDDVGNLLRLVDPTNNRTDSAYDAFDRLASETTYDGATPQARKQIYDNNGNVAISVDRNGRAMRTYYDRLDRVSEERWYPSETAARAQDGSYSVVVNFVYDAFGRLEERRIAHRVPAVIDRVTDSYEYDGLDRVLAHSNQSHFGSAFDSLDALGVASTPLKQTYVYAYNGSYTTTQRRQWVGNVNQTVTTTGVGPFGETNYVVDGDAQYGSGLEFEGASTIYAYDKSGALTSTTRETDWNNALGWQNQTQTVYGYDGAGRLASLDHASRRRTTTTWPAYSALVGFDYLYDPADRTLGIATAWNTAQPGLTTRPSSEAAAFTYDDAGQLTGVDSSVAGDDAGYAILANGQRYSSTEEGAAKLYAHGVQNRLTSDATYSYVYDAEGNLTERRLVSGNVLDQKYVWDHKNRLTKVENYASGTLSETIDYRYDAAGGLVRRSVDPVGTPPAVIEHYALEGGRRALTLDAAGNVKNRYSYAPSGEVLVDQAFAAGGETITTPLADHQGSPRILYGGAANSAPAVRQSVDYAPFGRITEIRDQNGAPTTSALDAAFGHHGSLLDQDTGLQLKGARWYSADLGRFVSVDPIQDGTNWYAFAGNDPVNQSDPTGLKALWSDPRNTLSSTHRNLIASQPLTSPGYKLQPTSFDASLRTSAGPNINATQQLGLASTRYTPYSPPAAPSRVAPAATPAAGRLLSGPAPRGDHFVRTIGSTPIVPRAAADLPGVAPLLREPNRYVAANYNNQGHMVLDVQQGGVRYVTGDDYLSIHEQSRRAGHQGQAAAWQAEFADIAGEALISISLAHETARDLGVLATGKDYYNPHEQFDANQRAMAGFFLVVPEGNSGQVRKGQKLLDAVNQPRAYSVAFETRLDATQLGLGRPEHFQIANESLRIERLASPELAELVPDPQKWGRPPSGWTWQHATVQQGGGQVGVLQLVPRAQHSPGSPFWPLFHPLPGGAGGYSEWAIPAGAPPN